jgi:hypothetical protein
MDSTVILSSVTYTLPFFFWIYWQRSMTVPLFLIYLPMIGLETGLPIPVLSDMRGEEAILMLLEEKFNR